MVWQPIRRAKEVTVSGVPPPMTPPMGSAFLWGSKIALNHLGVVGVVIVAERALQAAKAPGFSTSLFRLDRELSKATIGTR